MPSPFPGMDPYIEDPFFWPDFHATMMGIMRAALNGILPSRYVASIERHVWVQEHQGEEVTRLGSPDVQVADRNETGEGAAATATATARIAAPVTVVLPLTRAQGNRYLRILDRHRRRVVTAIEVLSPGNKTKGGYGVAYRAKRSDYLASDVNLVEIDLLRSGERPPLGEPEPEPSDYYLLVCPVETFPQAGFWPFSVRDRLPLVPVPLGPSEEPVSLDLRACLDRAYDEGRYASEIDYNAPPDPPIREPDAAWARELLAARPAGTHPTRGEQP